MRCCLHLIVVFHFFEIKFLNRSPISDWSIGPLDSKPFARLSDTSSASSMSLTLLMVQIQHVAVGSAEGLRAGGSVLYLLILMV